jgi:hypothetical protein
MLTYLCCYVFSGKDESEAAAAAVAVLPPGRLPGRGQRGRRLRPPHAEPRAAGRLQRGRRPAGPRGGPQRRLQLPRAQAVHATAPPTSRGPPRRAPQGAQRDAPAAGRRLASLNILQITLVHGNPSAYLNVITTAVINVYQLLDVYFGVEMHVHFHFSCKAAPKNYNVILLFMVSKSSADYELYVYSYN